MVLSQLGRNFRVTVRMIEQSDSRMMVEWQYEMAVQCSMYIQQYDNKTYDVPSVQLHAVRPCVSQNDRQTPPWQLPLFEEN